MDVVVINCATTKSSRLILGGAVVVVGDDDDEVGTNVKRRWLWRRLSDVSAVEYDCCCPFY